MVFEPLRFLAVFFLIDRCHGLTYFYGNGSYYVGEVDEMGRPSGNGQFYSKQGGLTYNGTFSGGQYNGTGVWYGHDGHEYQGEFLDGAASGKGFWSTPSGDTVKGDFRNHTIHGRAIWVFSNSVPRLEKMVGQFRRGLAYGDGIVYFRDGTRLEVKFKKGYPHGAGQLYDREGTKVWEGVIWNGTPMGLVPDNISDLFVDFHLSPLRLKYQPRL